MIEVAVDKYYYILDYYGDTGEKMALIQIKDKPFDYNNTVYEYKIIEVYNNYDKSVGATDYFYKNSAVHTNYLISAKAYNTPLWKVMNS
jgi:hypothetical protein